VERYFRQTQLQQNPCWLTCLQIEQWCEHNYPSFVVVTASGQQINSGDRRAEILDLDEKRDKSLLKEKQLQDARERGVVPAAHRDQEVSSGMPWDIMLFIFGIISLIVILSIGVAWVVITIYGDD
jgi:farnesyl-diphosphate farnesyltransferase